MLGGFQTKRCGWSPEAWDQGPSLLSQFSQPLRVALLAAGADSEGRGRAGRDLDVGGVEQPNLARDLAAITTRVPVADRGHHEGVGASTLSTSHARHPARELIIPPDASHYGHLQAPKAVTTAVLEFLVAGGHSLTPFLAAKPTRITSLFKQLTYSG